MTVRDVDRDTFTADWKTWHALHETTLADPHGFLAITGIHWLSEEPQRFPDVPGAWSSCGGGVRVELRADEELVVDGTPVHGQHSFGEIPERGGVNATFGDAVVEVAKRGGYDIIRPRHPEHPLRSDFAGTPAYEPDPHWAVPARFVPFDEARPVTVGASVEGLQHVYEAPRSRRVRRRRADAVADRVQRRRTGTPVHPVHRRHLEGHHLRRQPLAPRRCSGRRRQRDDRLQPRDEPPVCLHRLRDLPPPAGGEPAADRGRGGREDPAHASLNPSTNSAGRVSSTS